MTRHFVAGALALAIVTLLPVRPLAHQTGSSQAATAQTPPVNLNTATAADLEKLPGIGPATAARIVEYRQKNGAFKKAEELMNVQGIGEKTFLKLKSLVTVAPPKIVPRASA
jgi:competence protein ComEA